MTKRSPLRYFILRRDGRIWPCKRELFQKLPELKHAIPSHDTFSEVFRIIDPKALDAAFGQT